MSKDILIVDEADSFPSKNYVADALKKVIKARRDEANKKRFFIFTVPNQGMSSGAIKIAEQFNKEFWQKEKRERK